MWQKIKNIYHLFMAFVANLWYLYPSRNLKIIGVTGTDGKTTTVNLIYHILKTAGFKASMISSISAVIDGKAYDTGFHVTTPDSFAIQKFLRKAKKAKSDFFVIEVTSHAIDQNRIYGINFDYVVLTNITNEHLDYHKTYDNYLSTKAKVLKNAEKCIVNADDSSYTLLGSIKAKKQKENWITYGLSDSSDFNPKTFDIRKASLKGEFNKFNTLAAVAIAKSLGISDGKIQEAIKTFKMPIGRFDFVFQGNFKVMIDFAHTPNAFEKLLSTLRPLIKGRIIHVFGSAGERDVLKRPFLGEISSHYSDIIILTAEDPRSEDVGKIIAEIEDGAIKEKVEIIKIPDRKEAIEAAINMAKKGDLILITGKAQEASMNYGDGEIPWDEFKVVKDSLENI